MGGLEGGWCILGRKVFEREMEKNVSLEGKNCIYMKFARMGIPTA